MGNDPQVTSPRPRIGDLYSGKDFWSLGNSTTYLFRLRELYLSFSGLECLLTPEKYSERELNVTDSSLLSDSLGVQQGFQMPCSQHDYLWAPWARGAALY